MQPRLLLVGRDVSVFFSFLYPFFTFTSSSSSSNSPLFSWRSKGNFLSQRASKAIWGRRGNPKVSERISVAEERERKPLLLSSPQDQNCLIVSSPSLLPSNDKDGFICSGHENPMLKTVRASKNRGMFFSNRFLCEFCGNTFSRTQSRALLKEFLSLSFFAMSRTRCQGRKREKEKEKRKTEKRRNNGVF